MTIEGLGALDRLHPLQQAFLDFQAGPVRVLPFRDHYDGGGTDRSGRRTVAAKDRRSIGSKSLPMRRSCPSHRRDRSGVEEDIKEARRTESTRCHGASRKPLASKTGSTSASPVSRACSPPRLSSGRASLLRWHRSPPRSCGCRCRKSSWSRATRVFAERELHGGQHVDRDRRNVVQNRMCRGARSDHRAGGAMLKADRADRGRGWPDSAGRKKLGPGLLAGRAARELAAPDGRNRRHEPTAAPIGSSMARVDLLSKVTGGGFIHDLEMPAMLHGRVLRPPSYGARLESLDRSRGRGAARRGQHLVQRRFCRRLLRTGISGGQGAGSTARRRALVESETAQETKTGKNCSLRFARSNPSGGWPRPPLRPTRGGCPLSIRSRTCPRLDGALVRYRAFRRRRLTVWTHSQGVFPLERCIGRRPWDYGASKRCDPCARRRSLRP